MKSNRLKRFFVKSLSYIVCLSTPVSIVDAINEAASVSELDRHVVSKAGVFDEDYTSL